MSRHETLLSIYGAPSVPSKDTSRRLPLFRPSPPSSRAPANALVPRIRPTLATSVPDGIDVGAIAGVATVKTAHAVGQARPGTLRTVAEAVLSSVKLPVSSPFASPATSQQHEQHQQASSSDGDRSISIGKRETALKRIVLELQSNPPAGPPSPEAMPASTPKARERVNVRSSRPANGRRTTRADGTNNSNNASRVELVLSLYGDGFIEIPPSQTQDSALRKGFSLKIRLFKAADIEKDTSQRYVNRLVVR